MSGEAVIGACGLDCGKCEIYLSKTQPDTMRKVLDRLNEKWPGRCKPEDIRCDGCLGDRSTHWSADCDILACCVDAKGYVSCSECDELPCERLIRWSERGPRYSEAVDTLRAARARWLG